MEPRTSYGYAQRWCDTVRRLSTGNVRALVGKSHTSLLVVAIVSNMDGPSVQGCNTNRKEAPHATPFGGIVVADETLQGGRA
jgi:hypothetical protein